VTITSTSQDAMNVQVFDILGKQVKNETLTNNTLNVSNLKSGVYIVKITQNNASTTKKLVIK
ncbi:T9SS type A sorting domain-containing protein, partial [Oceanihabitans sediminis]